MTRVIGGIFDDVELGTGYFIPDKQIMLLREWLGCYADALEKGWVKRGSVGDPKHEKFAKVRSFLRATDLADPGHKVVAENEKEKEEPKAAEEPNHEARAGVQESLGHFEGEE